MSDLAQPVGTPTAIYRVVHGYRIQGGPRKGQWEVWYRYYWTLAGLKRYGLWGGLIEEEDRYIRVETAQIGNFFSEVRV